MDDPLPIMRTKFFEILAKHSNEHARLPQIQNHLSSYATLATHFWKVSANISLNCAGESRELIFLQTN